MNTLSIRNKLKIPLIAGLAITLFWSAVFQSDASTVHHHATGKTGINTNTGTYNGEISDPFSSDLDVKAKVSGGPEIIYALDISWGIMMFEYDYGATWNPTTHSYSYTPGRVNAQQGGWVTDNHVNNENNRIHIKNNSNFPMKADFSYNTLPGTLNADPSLSGSVTGIFSSSIGALELDESLLMEGVNGARVSSMTSASLTLEMISTNITSGYYYYYASNDNSDLAEQDMFFALSGVPDPGLPRNYSPVGAITIEIAPATNVTKKIK